MSIMEEAEIVCISGADGIDRIYPPPNGYREKIIQLIHKGGKHMEIVLTTCSLHYRWPKMRNDIKTHVSNCKSCFANSPSKLKLNAQDLAYRLKTCPQWIGCVVTFARLNTIRVRNQIIW